MADLTVSANIDTLMQSATFAVARTSQGVGTGDSPQFAAVNVGAATDTTVARTSAGVINVEGKDVYMVGGADVAVADGGTGASTLAAHGVLIGNGTGAVAVTGAGTSGQVLTSNGAGADPTFQTGGGGGGSGTVTSVSVTTANGVSGSVATATTTPAISLTLGAITPTSVNGMTISNNNVVTLRAAGSISSALDPTTFVFKELGVWSPTELIDPDYVMGQMVWNEPPDFLTHVQGSSGTEWLLTNGTMTVLGSVAAKFAGFDARMYWEAPRFGISVPIITAFTAGSLSIVTLGVHDGLAGVAHNTVQLRWNILAATLAVVTEDSGGTLTTLGSASFTPASYPFELGLSISALSVIAAVRYPGGNFMTIAKGTITANGAFDLRIATQLDDFNIVSVQTGVQGNSGSTLTLGNVKWGYLHGVNGLSDKMIRFTDGTPIQHGSVHYLINSVQDMPASTDEAVSAAGFTIQGVDVTKGRFWTQAKIFTNRGGKIFGENSGACIYDPDTDEFIYLIPNWGDFRSVSVFGPVHTYIYRRKGFPGGVIVLTGGAVFSGLPTATSDYDPDVQFFGGLWHMVYTRTNTTTAWNQYSTVHVTSPTMTAGSTWTQVAIQALGGSTQFEGPKIVKIGGTRYYLCCDNGIPKQQIVMDSALTQLGTFAVPTNTGAAGIGHACLVNYRDGANDRIFWLFFDGAMYDAASNCWGRIHILENTVGGSGGQQVGHDYEERLMLDAP